MPSLPVRRRIGAVLLMVLPAVLPGCEPSGTVQAEANALPALRRSSPNAPPTSLAAVERALASGHADQAAADLVALLAGAELPGPELTRAATLADQLGDPNARRLALTRRLEAGAGPSRPLRLQLAAVLLELGDAAASAALYEALISELPGQDERLALPLLESLARARTALDDHPGALAVRRRALEIAEDLAGDDGEAALGARVDLARSLARLDRCEDLELLVQGLPAGSRRLLLEATHGLTLARRGLHPAALARLDGAVDALAKLLPPSHPDLGRARLALARSRAANGDLQRARQDLTSLLTEQAADGHSPPALWRTQASLADLHLQAGDPAAARALDQRRLAHTGELLSSGHPLHQDALADLCWSLHAVGDQAGLDGRLAELRAGTAGLLDQLASQSPGTRERLLDQADAQLALVLALDLASDAPVEPSWRLLELRHARAGAVSIRAASAADDPDLADRRQHLRATSGRLDQLLDQGQLDQLARAAADAEAAQLAFGRGLVERGLPAPAIDLAEVAAALPPDGLFLALDAIDLGLPGAEPVAPRLLAHVLTPDGRASRHLLAPLDVLERAAADWLAAGAALHGAEHQALAALLVEPLAGRTDAARVWWLRSAPGLPALPLEALAGGAALVELPDLGPVLAPRPAWDLPARLVSAVLPDLDGQPAVDGSRPAPGRTPGLPIRLSPGSRELAEVLGARILELERRHEPRGGGAQRVSGPHATRATLGRLVAETRDLFLALPVWSSAADRRPTIGSGPSRSQQRRPRLEGSGARQGLALTGALRGRDGLGRLDGLASLDDLARLHLLAADLVCLPTPEGDRPALRQALHRAGARAVLMPLWPADSDARTLLLDEVLRRHWEQGLPARQALREAQGALLAAGHPGRDVLGWRLTAAP